MVNYRNTSEKTSYGNGYEQLMMREHRPVLPRQAKLVLCNFSYNSTHPVYAATGTLQLTDH